MKTIALFQTTRSVIKAERVCLESGIQCKVIPVPRDISSECGMALEIDEKDKDRILDVCKKNHVQVSFVSL